MTASRRIPLVDLSHYERGSASERARFVATFGDALREFGFVTVTGHGIEKDLIARAYAAVRALFALPEEQKARYLVPGGAGQRGYTGRGAEHAKNRKVGDLKEFWHVGRDAYGENLWPSEVPALEETTLPLFGALESSARTMLRALAEYLGVPRNTLSDMIENGNSILRLIHYPPLRDLFVPGAVRAAEHEDINLITLLCEGTASGLEILTRDGEWIPVDTLKDQIVVDSGDMLQRVTKGVIPSTTHRVVNPPGDDTERYSMPFFVHPYPDCALHPLPLKEAEHLPDLPLLTADQFLRQRLIEIGLIKSS